MIALILMPPLMHPAVIIFLVFVLAVLLTARQFEAAGEDIDNDRDLPRNGDGLRASSADKPPAGEHAGTVGEGDL